MRAHVVLAHPSPRSFNAHLAGVAAETLRAQGWEVSLTDLYAAGFDPCEAAGHFGLDPAAGFDVQAAQRAAVLAGRLPPEVAAEVAACDAADLLVLQYPMWWHMPPAMLKGWFDRVFAFGEVYAAGKRFETGRWRGRRAMLSVTVGTSAATYAHDGRSGDIGLMLWPVHFNLAYVGYTVLAPQVSYGVEGATGPTDPAVLHARLAGAADDLRAALRDPGGRATIPFNPTTDWGPDGRILPGAPAHSAFMRHRAALDLG